jgi:hypothetical protein
VHTASISREGSKDHILGGGWNVQQARIALFGFCVLAGNTYQPSARADDQSLEEIVVTGSRIARPTFEAGLTPFSLTPS